MSQDLRGMPRQQFEAIQGIGSWDPRRREQIVRALAGPSWQREGMPLGWYAFIHSQHIRM